MNSALEQLKTFDERHLPDLDTAVRGALEFFSQTALPALPLQDFKNVLVVGSGNAAALGRLLFEEESDVWFADESTYGAALERHGDIRTVVVVSASGEKHAVSIVRDALARGLSVFLLTNTESSSAAALLDRSSVTVFPKIREPYTYNVSTYLGFLLARFGEKPDTILNFIESDILLGKRAPLEAYDAFFFLVPPQFDAMRGMFVTKFDELFGAKISVRAYTPEQAKHAKTVVPSETECFVSFGAEHTEFGDLEKRVYVPLPGHAGPACMMAAAYAVIGRIQSSHPPFFKENIVRYTAEASKLFGQAIGPIAE